MRRYLLQFIFLSALCFLPPPVWAYEGNGCVNLTKDKPGVCIDSSDCSTQCTESVVRRATLDPLSPGFFVGQSSQGYFVAAVVPNSPAFRSGLLPGDQVLSVDGLSLAIFCPLGAEVWQEKRAHEIKVRREGQTLTKRLTPDSLDQVFAAAALDVSNHSLVSADVLTQPYVSGIVTKFARDRLIVAAVLHGTEAERAGILEGDQIIALNGGAALGSSAASRMQGDDHRASMHLCILRRGKALDFQFELGSVTEALYRLAIDADSSRATSGGAF